MIGIYEQFKGDDKQDWAVFALIFVRHRLISLSMRHFFSLKRRLSTQLTEREEVTKPEDEILYVALIILVMDNLMSSD